MLEVHVSPARNEHHHEARQVTALFQQLVDRHALHEQVCVSETMGFGTSHEGATVQVGGCIYTGVTAENAEFVFEEYVLDLLQRSAS